jgi:hypothetical protein
LYVRREAPALQQLGPVEAAAAEPASFLLCLPAMDILSPTNSPDIRRPIRRRLQVMTFIGFVLMTADAHLSWRAQPATPERPISLAGVRGHVSIDLPPSARGASRIADIELPAGR